MLEKVVATAGDVDVSFKMVIRFGKQWLVILADPTIVSRQTFVFASGGAALSVVNSTFTGLTSFNDVIQVTGAGTTLSMFNTNIKDIKIEGVTAFTGVRIEEGASGTVTRSAFTGNTGVSVSDRKASYLSLFCYIGNSRSCRFGCASLVTYPVGKTPI
jgi:hypothetical protein